MEGIYHENTLSSGVHFVYFSPSLSFFFMLVLYSVKNFRSRSQFHDFNNRMILPSANSQELLSHLSKTKDRQKKIW